MAKVRIRIGFNQAGFLHSVKNEDTGALASFVPGTSMPVLGSPPSAATSASRLFRVWPLADKVVIENAQGSTVAEGNKGDYLMEDDSGGLFIVKAGDIRDGLDPYGEVFRIYRTPTPDALVVTDVVIGRMKDGTEF